MKHFIVAAALYALCGAQGENTPSVQIYGAFVSENSDVRDLVATLLNSCPALSLPETSTVCINAPVCRQFPQPTPKMTDLVLRKPRLQAE
jgi:hypothetical protein